VNKSELRSIDAIFRPQSIAVIGASRKRYQIGHEIVRNLVLGGFTGRVYPVNPKANVVHSMHCYPKVSAIRDAVDLAVITVPAPLVLAAAKDCARKGVKALIVITAGFSEVGGEGTKRQEELMKVCRKAGMRVVGPNCMGVVNTDPDFAMNASFAASTPSAGGAAFLSQSGALGEAILADARQLGLGVSMFASVGNRADVDPSDLLDYWAEDPRCKQVLMYLEAFGDPERFIATARRVSRQKPILVVKSGRSARGAEAAISHTGSLAGSEAAVDSLLNQCGVLRLNSMADLFALASAAQTGKFPKGPRVGIVTNAGGPAILATDACFAQGLEMGDLKPASARKLKRFLPPEASVANPVDLIASGNAESYDKALDVVLADDSVDMVLAIFVSPVMIDSAEVARVFVKHAEQSDKPLVACLLGKSQGEDAAEILAQGGVPNYRFPEFAAQALAGLHQLQQLHQRPELPLPKFRVQRAKARRVIEGVLADGRNLLQGQELHELFTAYGIPMVPSKVVSNRDEALQAARKLGFPLVMKVEAEDVVHKSDRGGVLVGIRDREGLLDGYDQLEDSFRKECPQMKILMQSMRSEGIETFFGAATDPQFGRMLAFGLGGVHVEVFKDVLFRLHPLDPTDAREMVEGVRAKALFRGARGKPPVDEEQLVDTLLRLSRLLTDNPEIAEFDLNPYLAAWDNKESCVLDARVRLEQA
jgi:acetyl coenzyme A synthetase (ADP forming)-like protein